jgi:hypothetical protein
MKEFADRAYAKCAAILRSGRETTEPESMFRHRRHGETLLNKWCMNLLSFLLMDGGGQQPQVYRHLIVPEPAEIAEWGTKEVSLRTSLEKNSQEPGMPSCLVSQAGRQAYSVSCATRPTSDCLSSRECRRSSV